MPKMFGEPDLDAFQRLRCAFDPAGLANPGKVMPTPRLCGEVPGPVPAAPAGGRRPGGAVLSGHGASVTTERPGSPEEAAELLRSLGEAGSAVRPRGGGTKLDWGRLGEPIARRPRDGRAGRSPRAQRGRLHRGARGRRAAGRGAGGVRRRGPDARARPAAGRGRRGDDRRRSWRPPTPARCATATAACATSSSASRVALSDGTLAQVGRQGDQERRGLRPRPSCSPARTARSG